MEAEPSKADSPKRKRRWFQFSLRTLLIFTLIESKELVESPNGRYGLVTACSMSLVKWDDVPLVRRWLSDHHYDHVVLFDSAPDDMLERYRAVFPEAVVCRLSEAKKLLPKEPFASPLPWLEPDERLLRASDLDRVHASDLDHLKAIYGSK